VINLCLAVIPRARTSLRRCRNYWRILDSHAEPP